MTDTIILLLTIAAGAVSSFVAYWFGRISAVKEIKAITASKSAEDALPEPGSNITQLKPKVG